MAEFGGLCLLLLEGALVVAYRLCWFPRMFVLKTEVVLLSVDRFFRVVNIPI